MSAKHLILDGEVYDKPLDLEQLPCQTNPARISNASLELTSKVALAQGHHHPPGGPRAGRV